MTTASDAGGGRSYGQILKSTLVIGGSSAIGVVLAVVRNKLIAAMLGPEGIGLIGLYTAMLDIASAVAGLGIQASGVRRVAELAEAGDRARIAQCNAVLNRLSLLLAFAGALVLASLALPVARFTFGDGRNAVGVALLALALFLRLIGGGMTALIQGMRDIAGLARINVLGALLGTAITLPLIYRLGAAGIVPSLIGSAAAILLVTWWRSRRMRLPSPSVPAVGFAEESGTLLRLGLVFMASGVLTFGAAYAIRIIVLHAQGAAAMGLYQAAWAIGGLYGGFILQAMGTDFYPRLAGIAGNDREVNRLVNEQIRVSILLAGPGVVATLAFASPVMHLFYTAEFTAGTDLLRWICLGMMLRIISWPMGFIIIAKSAQALFFWTEVAAATVHVGLAWLLVGPFGVAGAGAAFLGLYVWHTGLVCIVVGRLSGFRCSGDNLRLCAIFLAASSAVLAAGWTLPEWGATAAGVTILLSCGLYSLKVLAGLVPPESVPVRIRGLLARLA